MIDEKNVRLMTRLSVYENKEGKEDFKINRYSSRVYVNMKVLESSIAVTFAYLLAVFLYSFRFYSEISTKGFSFPYRTYLIYILGIYGVIFLGHFIYARKYYRRRYDKMRRNIRHYDRDLYILKKNIQKEKDPGTQG